MLTLDTMKTQAAAAATESEIFKSTFGFERVALAVYRVTRDSSRRVELCRWSAAERTVQFDLRWTEGLELGVCFFLWLIHPDGRRFAVGAAVEAPLEVVWFDAKRGVTIRVADEPSTRGAWRLHIADRGRTASPGDEELLGLLNVEVLCRSPLRLRVRAPLIAGAGEEIPLKLAVLAGPAPSAAEEVRVEVEAPRLALEEVVVRRFGSALNMGINRLLANAPLPADRRRWMNLSAAQQRQMLVDQGVHVEAERGRRFELRPLFDEKSGEYSVAMPAAETTVPGIYNCAFRARVRGDRGAETTRVEYRQIVVAVRPRAESTALDIRMRREGDGWVRYTVDCTFRDVDGNTYIVRDPGLIDVEVTGAQAVVDARSDGTTRLDLLVPEDGAPRRLHVRLHDTPVVAGFPLPDAAVLRPGVVVDAPGVDRTLYERLADPFDLDVRAELRPGQPLHFRPPAVGWFRSFTVFTTNSQRSVPYRVDVLRGGRAVVLGVGWGTQTFKMRALRQGDVLRVSVAATPADWDLDPPLGTRGDMFRRPGWQQPRPAVHVHGLGFL